MSHRSFRDVFCSFGRDDLLQREERRGGKGLVVCVVVFGPYAWYV